MEAAKQHIIAQLQRDILSLQGFKHISNAAHADILPRQIKDAFPNRNFPLAAVHEFVNNDEESEAATTGFISCIISSLMKKEGAVLWVSPSVKIFPVALKAFGIPADKIVFIDAKKPKEALWTMEEALKCEGLAAVVGEVSEISFTESRRLQLAVEQSHVTGFIIRNRPRNMNVNACVSRWKISHLLSEQKDDLPGIGFPRWNIELIKIRNGKPGAWQVEWGNSKLKIIPSLAVIEEVQTRKAG